ncbi:MAG: hypothetical protein R2778_05730 [Saprospiraceae bacterium]
MRKFTLLCTFLLIVNYLTAQNEAQEPENEFAFAIVNAAKNKKEGDVDKSSDKFKTAKKVFDKLVAARGDFRYPIPDFVMSDQEKKVAWMNYDRLEVGIEEKAYNVCMKFGADSEAALAMLLGHELSHYYEKHNWRREFARQYYDLAVGKDLGVMTRADSVFNETQADYVGGFLAFSAGYPVFDKGAELTEALYKAYKFPNALRIYPILEERKELNRRSAQLIDRLVNIFETANLLTATGDYESAEKYYQYILQDYQSPSLYNNAGVMAVMAALDIYRDPAINYLVPVELDLNSIGSRDGGTQVVYFSFLQQALRHFDAAINLNPDYAPSYLNKACVLTLLHDKKRSKYLAELEIPAVLEHDTAKLFQKTATDLKVLNGILAWEDGDSTKADKIFQDLMKNESSEIADENLTRLRTKKPSEKNRTSSNSGNIETIDDIDLFMDVQDIKIYSDQRVYIAPGMKFYQNNEPKEKGSSKYFKTEREKSGKKEVHYFLVTKPGYKGKTAAGLKVGSSEQDLLKEYKSPNRKIESTRGQIWVYENIIFFLENNPKPEISGWALFFDE